MTMTLNHDHGGLAQDRQRTGTATPPSEGPGRAEQRGKAGKTLGRRLIQLTTLALLSLLPALLTAAPAWALIHAHPDESTATGVVRSLESLRDLDYQSWQVVAYREGPPSPDATITLRIVGYPGRVRLDHPTPMLVTAGRRLWELADTTLTSPKLAGDGRAAAAEFNLTPLLADLHTNRPLRLELPGVFTELPVPPYVVEEWRSLPAANPP
jgi:hypothetical protein